MAILDELKDKIGVKANKANNIQEAVAEMPMLEPLYLVGDPTTLNLDTGIISTNVKWVDALEAFRSGRRVIARVDLRSLGQQAFYGDVVMSGASYAENVLAGQSYNSKVTVVPMDEGFDDTVAVLRLEN